MKSLKMFMTSNLQSQIDQATTGDLLVMLSALFEKQPYDMYIIEPDANRRLQIRLAGYNFMTDELDEETVIKRTDLKGNQVILFKVDDYGDSYVGTLLLPEDY